MDDNYFNKYDAKIVKSIIKIDLYLKIYNIT